MYLSKPKNYFSSFQIAVFYFQNIMRFRDLTFSRDLLPKEGPVSDHVEVGFGSSFLNMSKCRFLLLPL